MGSYSGFFLPHDCYLNVGKLCRLPPNCPLNRVLIDSVRETSSGTLGVWWQYQVLFPILLHFQHHLPSLQVFSSSGSSHIQAFRHLHSLHKDVPPVLGPFQL